MLPPTVTILYPKGGRSVRHRYRPPPRKRLPMGIVQAYIADLRRLIAEYQRRATEVIDRWLPQIVEAADRAAPPPVRKDSIAGDSGGMRRDLEKVGGEVFSDEAARLLASRVAAKVDVWDRKELSRQLLHSLGVDLVASEPWLADHLGAFVKNNVALIKSIPKRHHDDVERLVMEGVRTGSRVEEIRSRLMDNFGVSKSRGDLISRDQVLKLNAEIDTLRQQSIGVVRQKWQTSQDERVRSRHSAVNGVVYFINDPPPAGPKGAKLRPGQDFQCRCQGLAVLEDLLDDVQESAGASVRYPSTRPPPANDTIPPPPPRSVPPSVRPPPANDTVPPVPANDTIPPVPANDTIPPTPLPPIPPAGGVPSAIPVYPILGEPVGAPKPITIPPLGALPAIPGAVGDFVEALTPPTLSKKPKVKKLLPKKPGKPKKLSAAQKLAKCQAARLVVQKAQAKAFKACAEAQAASAALEAALAAQ